MNIAEVAIKRPVFIVMIIISIITLGLVGYFSLSVDLLPNVDFPNLVVVASYPGASSDEMETLITKKLENAIGTVEGLDTLSSTTREGSAFIVVTFTLGTDLKFAELKVREKVEATLPQLPQDLVLPIIRSFSSDDIPIAVLSVKGPGNRADLTELINNVIAQHIEAAPGVGGITIFGGLDKTVNVTINKSLLLANQLSYSQVVQAIASRNISIPAGIIYGSEKNVTLRVYGKADKVADLGNIALTGKNGNIILVKDIADIKFGTADEVTRARVDGQSAVLFAVYKQSGGNTITVVENVRKSIVELAPLLPSGTSLKVVNDTSLTIKRSITGVEQDILFGAILAIIIVWFFLGNFRSTIITALALPNSLLGAFFLIFIAGFTINTMTLLSLSLAVGLLIDDSIVVRENIFRHRELGESPKSAAVKGTTEVGLAVLSTTLSILAVFIPISFLQGVIGQFFRQFGLTVAFALLISLLDAFTTAPMLSAYWYKQSDDKLKGIGKYLSSLSVGWNKVYGSINTYYKSVLEWSLNHKKAVLGSVLAIMVLIVFLSRYIGQNFTNYTDNGLYTINLELYPGASLDKIDFYTKQVETFLSKQKGIDTYYSQIGQNTLSHLAQISVTMKPLGQRSISTQDTIVATRNYIRQNYDRDLIYRVNEQAAFGGSGSIGGGPNFPINMNIYGDDLGVLEQLSYRATTILAETAGATDINTTMKPGTPELVIKLDNQKAELAGITAIELGNILRDLVTGATVSTYTVGENDYSIILRLTDRQRNSVSDYDNFMITTRTGKKVLLTSFTDISYASAPLEIRRENNRRIVKVTGNIAKGYSLTKVITDAKANLAKSFNPPTGYTYEFVGQQKDFANLVQQMVVALGLALVFMYLILASLYNSFTQPLYLMLSIPLAIVGSFLGLLATGIDLDLYGYIGILLVFGLVAKNAILLLDFTNKQRQENGMSIREALLHAGPIRLRPILMTTFAMIFGMLPLALGLDEGSSGRQALPITVIGGLLTSTFLTLVIVPIVYEWAETRFERRRLKKQQIETQST
jgi:hydrophobic/amphiphilic exporter-1 (mainly G- bacteria), HAE1 family